MREQQTADVTRTARWPIAVAVLSVLVVGTAVFSLLAGAKVFEAAAEGTIEE